MEKDLSLLDTKQVQVILLKIAKQIAAVLERHRLPHMIILGAVRHRGFIP